MRNQNERTSQGTWRTFSQYFRPHRQPSAATPQRRLRPAERVSAGFQDPAFVLFHQSTGVVFMSNHVGARIWEGVARGEPVAALTAALSDDYGLDAATIGRDVERFIDELLRTGLLCEEREP
jgi:hypothetical protein